MTDLAFVEGFLFGLWLVIVVILLVWIGWIVAVGLWREWRR